MVVFNVCFRLSLVHHIAPFLLSEHFPSNMVVLVMVVGGVHHLHRYEPCFLLQNAFSVVWSDSVLCKGM
jgi:hypothetical protein